MPAEAFHAILAELPEFEHPRAPFIRSAAVVSDGATFQILRIEPEARLETNDQHTFDQTVIVFSGTFAVTLDDRDEYVLEAGHLLYVPGDVPHRGRVVGDEPVIAAQIFAPSRDEYRPMAAAQLGVSPT